MIKLRFGVIGPVILICAACSSGVQDGMVKVPGSMYTPMSNATGALRIDDLYWEKEPVTVKDWHNFVAAAYSQFSFEEIAASAESSTQMLFGNSHWPMQSVTWYEAILYCNWRSKVENLQPAYQCLNNFPIFPGSRDIVNNSSYVKVDYKANGYRLPTSAEWEYAARGGRSGIAKNWDIKMDFLKYGFFLENANKQYHPVGQKMPNPVGLYDMVSLVGEWCWDGETESVNSATIGEAHIIRGGSIYDSGTKGFEKIVNGFLVEGSGRPEFFSQPRYSPGLGRGAIGFRIVRRIGENG